jgi:flagellar biosynthesis/type III secretory pathway chaperone
VGLMTHEWVQKLCRILEQMEHLYARIPALLDKEKKSLIEMNFESLYIELAEKDEILSTIRKLDKERVRIQDSFATLNSLSPQDVNLKVIADHMIESGGPDADLGMSLMGYRERISSFVVEIQGRLYKNQVFIEKSVKNIRGLAQAVAEVMGQSQSGDLPSQHQTYTGKAKVKKPSQKSGSIMTKQL